ncbi:MAG: chemotaxis protein CheW [Alphaproteobacteria bacterium]|nr:chemotaxis protein CheW [Alphaproteobacteria bacterium]
MSTQTQQDSTISPSAMAMADSQMFVTMRIDRQLIGIPVRFVRDVLRGQKVTPIPLSPPEVSGSLNLRGRIVTVIDVRRRLRLPEMSADAKYMFVVVDHKGELYSLMVDHVGDVLTAPSAAIEKVPANLGGAWREVASGIYKMSDELLVIIDVETLLKLRMH